MGSKKLLPPCNFHHRGLTCGPIVSLQGGRSCGLVLCFHLAPLCPGNIIDICFSYHHYFEFEFGLFSFFSFLYCFYKTKACEVGDDNLSQYHRHQLWFQISRLIGEPKDTISNPKTMDTFSYRELYSDLKIAENGRLTLYTRQFRAQFFFAKQKAFLGYREILGIGHNFSLKN